MAKRKDVNSPIRALRKAKGWSARELAEAITRGGRECSGSIITKIETGSRSVEPLAAEIAKALGVPVSRVMAGAAGAPSGGRYAEAPIVAWSRLPMIPTFGVKKDAVTETVTVDAEVGHMVAAARLPEAGLGMPQGTVVVVDFADRGEAAEGSYVVVHRGVLRPMARNGKLWTARSTDGEPINVEDGADDFDVVGRIVRAHFDVDRLTREAAGEAASEAVAVAA